MLEIGHFFLRFQTRFIYLFVFLGLGLTLSCNTNAQKDEPRLSDPAKKALTYADTLAYYGHAQRSLIYLDSSYSTFKPNTKDLFEKYHANVQYYLSVRLDIVNANDYADSMLLILKTKEQQYKLEYATALFVKGDVVLEGREYNKAFKYYYDAREYMQKNLDSCKFHNFSHRLGIVRYKQERYLEAIPYIKQALVEKGKCNDEGNIDLNSLSKQALFNTIGLCFERVGRLDSAIFYYHQAVALIDKVSLSLPDRKDFIQTAKGVVFGNMGGTYAKLGRYREAEKYLKESIAINDRPHFAQVDAQTAKLKLADLYLRFSKFKGVSILLKELQFALDHPLPEREMMTESRLKLYQLQWQYFDRIHDLTKAYQKMQQFYHLSDSVKQVNQNLKGADMSLAFKASEQQNKLILLDKENKMKRDYLISIVVFAIIVVIVLLVVWRSRLKIAEQNLNMQRILKALEKSQEENARVMKIIAHDLRMPIAAAINIANVFKIRDLPKEDHELLDQLETMSQHSLAMMEELLNLNEKPKGLIKEAVELHILLRFCVNLHKFRAEAKGLELKLKTQEVVMQADGEKIWRVFSNLIMNAIKFSAQGKTIEISMYLEQDAIVTKVVDQGIGVPVELMDNIFDIYTDAKREGTAGEHSFGMGLAISKQIVEAHGGRIWIESKMGYGSTFFVLLPIG